MTDRERILTVVIGAAGTGKTTYLRKIVKGYPGKVLILDVNNEWPEHEIISSSRLGHWSRGKKRSVVRIALTNPDVQCDHVIRLARNCLIVADDLDKYTWLDNLLLRPMFVGYRHYGWDVIAVFHSVQTVYRPAYENMQRFVIFAQDPKSAERLMKLGFQVPTRNHEMKVYKLR